MKMMSTKCTKFTHRKHAPPDAIGDNSIVVVVARMMTV